MARTIISAKYPPLIDPTRTTLAYGRLALVILKKNLQEKNLLLRQRSFMALSDYLRDPEHIAEAIQLEFIDLILNQIYDKNVTIRRKCAEVLGLFASHSIGRQALVDNEVVPSLIYLLDDPEDVVRQNSYRALELLTLPPFGAEAVVKEELVCIAIGKLLLEPDPIKMLIFDLLHNCFRLNVQKGLECRLIYEAKRLLSHSKIEIQWRAARCIADICQVLEGKNSAIEYMVSYPLIEMLHNRELLIKRNAVLALMRIAITTKGKYTLIEAKAIPSLIELLNDDSSEVRISSLQTLDCISEAPEGRILLKPYLNQIKLLRFDLLNGVSKSAISAVKTITWQP